MGIQLAQATSSYWSVLLESGKERAEITPDLSLQGYRVLDWSHDIVGACDIRHIKELRLHCPGGAVYLLKIDEPGTAFQLKVGQMHGFFGEHNSTVAQLIGKVVDKTTGACECIIHDAVVGGVLTMWNSTVYHLGSWRPGVAPIGLLNLTALGIDCS